MPRTNAQREPAVTCAQRLKPEPVYKMFISIKSCMIDDIVFHLRTIWLFASNDIKSIVVPETAFGIFSALSGSSMTMNPSPDFFIVISRLPRVAFWLWLNLLLFTISNQSLQDSVKEDSVNKPWRPIPSKRISLSNARRLLLLTIPAVTLLSYYVGAVEVTIVLMVLTWMYNDLGGADENFFLRNLLNLFGFISYSLGATLIAADPARNILNATAYQWLALIGLVVLTTLQIQDLADQEGDRLRGRSTIPLVMGDASARWTIAVPILAWSFICPAFWRSYLFGYIGPLGVGCLIAWRTLSWRTVAADKVTWKLWCLWTMTLYMLPLCQKQNVAC